MLCRDVSRSSFKFSRMTSTLFPHLTMKWKAPPLSPLSSPPEQHTHFEEEEDGGHEHADHDHDVVEEDGTSLSLPPQLAQQQQHCPLPLHPKHHHNHKSASSLHAKAPLSVNVLGSSPPKANPLSASSTRSRSSSIESQDSLLMWDGKLEDMKC